MSSQWRRAEDVRVTYDAEVDVAYLTLVDRGIQPGKAVYQSDLISTPNDRGTLLADFDVEGRLLGIEVLAARGPAAGAAAGRGLKHLTRSCCRPGPQAPDPVRSG